MGGGIKLNLSITITIPDWLGQFFVALTLFYRRARYGYAFRRIPLTQGKYAIIDLDDFERLNKHKWYAVRGKNTFYAARTIRVGKKRISIKMHREVIHPPDHLFVDHINRNGLDNRKVNLRPATHVQNSWNTRKSRRPAYSKYRGITFRKGPQKWAAMIRVAGNKIFLGSFEDELEAAKAYDEAAKKYHGEFASLNFEE